MPEALEKLVVWQKAIDLAEMTYELTTEFPDDERFGLASQIRRAGTSIASNIAEGYGRVGRRDYARYLGIARGSAYEVFTQLVIARRAGYEIDDVVLERVEEILRMLNSMINKLGSNYTNEERADYDFDSAELLTPTNQ